MKIPRICQGPSWLVGEGLQSQAEMEGDKRHGEKSVPK